MIILDFLFYYLTYWFGKNKDKLRWSTPLERTVYAVGLISMVWIYSLNEILTYTLKGFNYHFSMLVYLFLGLAIMQLYKYIYITKNRYNLLIAKKKKPGNINNKTGAIISIIFLFITILLPLIILIIFVPFGKHR